MYDYSQAFPNGIIQRYYGEALESSSHDGVGGDESVRVGDESSMLYYVS